MEEEVFYNSDGRNLTIEQMEQASKLIESCAERIREINNGTYFPRLGVNIVFDCEESKKLKDAMKKLNNSMTTLMTETKFS